MLSRLFAVLVLSIVCALPAAAQSPSPTPSPTPAGPIKMDLDSPLAAHTPLALYARFGTWFPIAVNLANTGDAVSGELRLRLLPQGDFSRTPNEFATAVDLPSQSNKQVWLYGRKERDNVASVEISFSGRGFKPLIQVVPLQNLEDFQRVVVTFTDGDAPLPYLNNQDYRGPGFNLPGTDAGTSTQASVRSLTASKSLIPDRWVGLENANMVVLGDFAHTELRPLQISALRNFANSGGNLLVPAGANWQRLAQSPLADLWPVQLQGSIVATSAQAQNLARKYVPNPTNGGDRLGGAPVVLARGTLKPDAVLRDGSNALPLFAIQDTGAGRCALLAYDPTQPPFLGWSGLPSLWKDVFATTRTISRLDSLDPAMSYAISSNTYNPNAAFGYQQENAASDSTTNQLLNAVSKAPQLRMPPVSQIAWFLALYVFFLVPVNYAVLRILDRRELAWITIPGIVVVFSLLAYQTALNLRGRAILTRQVDIVQSTVGSTEARVDSLLWLFSPRKTTYDLSSAAKSAAVADYVMPNLDATSLTVRQPEDGSSFVTERASVLMWADRPFVSESVVDLGQGFTYSSASEPVLTNRSSLPLKKALLIQDGRIRPFGDIAPGAKATAKAGDGVADVSSRLAGRILAASDLNSIYDANAISNNIPANTLAVVLARQAGSYYGGNFIVGWADDSASPITFSGQPKGRNLTLVILRIPPTPRNLASTREAVVNQVSYTPVPTNAVNAIRGGRSGGEAIYEAILPAASNLQVTVRGTGLGLAVANNNDPYYYNQNRQAVDPGSESADLKAINVAYWNAGSSTWVKLPGQVIPDRSSVGGWRYVSPLPPAARQSSQGRLRLRAQLGKNGVTVSSLRIHSVS